MLWWGQTPDLVGTDLEFQDRNGQTYAFVASMGTGLRIFDITDRSHPQLVGLYASPGYQNDVQVQGNLAILSSDLPPYPGDPHHPQCASCGLFEGIELIDVTNPSRATRLSDLYVEGGAHNSTIVGSTVYISNISARSIDIVDISNPRQPRLVTRVAEPAGCLTSPYPCQIVAPGEANWRPHDITPRILPNGGHRLYVAAVESTVILDIGNPHSPRVVAKIANGAPVSNYSSIQISHQADPSPDGRLLVVSDERGGGATEIGCPGGGLHVYDITDETKPIKLGIYFAPDTRPRGNCTAHVFRFLPDRNVLAIGWYSAGSWLVDLSGPAGADELDNTAAKPGQKTTWGTTLGWAIMSGANAWATKSPGVDPAGRLFMFTDDIVRGMDVFEFTGSLPHAQDPHTQ